MSAHTTEPTNASDAGTSATAGTPASNAITVEAPNLAPDHGDNADQTDVAKTDMSRSEAVRFEVPKPDAARNPGKIMIMSPQRERSWEDFVDAEPQPEPELHAASASTRRFSAMTAVVLLVALTGAAGGSLATAGLGHLLGNYQGKTVLAQSHALEEAIARLDTEVAVLKGEFDRAGKQSAAGRAKTADRLDRLEKAQGEPNAKIAKLSETVEKLRAQPAPVPAPVASIQPKEVTGSISPPTPAQVPAPKPEVARLPTIDGWVLLEVANGGATIEGRPGIFEVYAGDPVPGLGRIDAIRKQDGRWVVVTSKGLVVAR
ncbi:hypothetical protein BH11PSE4_BH11PSE4_38570 [soil metagenome]